MSIDLAAEALDWLFSITSNPTVQSIAVQSVGGLPMASEEKLFALRGGRFELSVLQHSLLLRIQGKNSSYNASPYKLVPETALALGRLLRFYPHSPKLLDYTIIATPEFDPFELKVAMLCNGYHWSNGETEPVSPGTFFIDIISSSELPPRCWYHLMIQSKDVLSPLAPDIDNNPTNSFPLDLCSAILYSFSRAWMNPTQDFHSLLVDDFHNSVPYFLEKIYDLVLPMFSSFVEDPSLCELSLPQSLRVLVAAVKFMLHRLFLPNSDTSHYTIRSSLYNAVLWIRGQTFSLQEATAVMTVLDDILGVIPSLGFESDWVKLCNHAILAILL
ncbi:hypothetical protein IW261DRAFT_527447 [Armillaria novae-zelandiae]|uniref:Uncharacterized protein n=1 Tax=Armillaria novae-zelandiae TaxID=153914 RepID=A0AA39P0M2_9AGAR|nr:hypothetical protein IW261DRAFT_527447 [Armillaria novae-zelandiae]